MNYIITLLHTSFFSALYNAETASSSGKPAVTADMECYQTGSPSKVDVKGCNKSCAPDVVKCCSAAFEVNKFAGLCTCKDTGASCTLTEGRMEAEISVPDTCGRPCQNCLPRLQNKCKGMKTAQDCEWDSKSCRWNAEERTCRINCNSLDGKEACLYHDAVCRYIKGGSVDTKKQHPDDTEVEVGRDKWVKSSKIPSLFCIRIHTKFSCYPEVFLFFVFHVM